MIPVDTYWSIEPARFAAMIESSRNATVVDVAVEESSEPSFSQSIGNSVVIDVVGVMVKRASAWASLFGVASINGARRAVEAASTMANVRNIMVRFDTPGGAVDGLAEFGDAIRGARAAGKRVIAQVDGMCCSAGYYIASLADEVVAGRMDLIGSIGTRVMLYDFSKLFANEGIEAVPIDTGEYKSAGAMGTEITDSHRADFQRIVDAYFSDFRDTVMEGRGMSRNEFDAVADGRVFTAGEALGLGLIDRIGTIEDTVGRLAEEQKSADSTRSRSRDWSQKGFDLRKTVL